MLRAKESLEPKTYLPAREGKIDAAQLCAEMEYRTTFKRLMDIGYTTEQARKHAVERAKDVASLELEIVDADYPLDTIAAVFGADLKKATLDSTTALKAIKQSV